MNISIPELESITGMQRLYALKNLIEYMDRGWFRRMLKTLNIPKRTVMYKAYGYLPEDCNIWYDSTEEERDELVKKQITNRIKYAKYILDNSKWEDWVNKFVKESTLDSICYFIECFTTLSNFTVIVNNITRQEEQLAEFSSDFDYLRIKIQEITGN